MLSKLGNIIIGVLPLLNYENLTSGDGAITDVVRRTCEMLSTCQVRRQGALPGIECHRLISSDNSIEVFSLYLHSRSNVLPVYYGVAK